jgi:replicative DNA helicase
MAKMLDVPVLVVSSLSRANETRDVKIPVMSDLRETGQLEFDADVIMFLHLNKPVLLLAEETV